MAQPLAGAGQGLQYPQGLYPSGLLNGAPAGNTNDFTLAPGQALPVPAGRYVLTPGAYGSVQYLDPVTNVWTLLRDNNNNAGTYNIWSDGYNVRVANLTGCVVGGVVTSGGNNAYVAATTTVTPSTGTSTWTPIVGGAVNATVSITAVGAAYTIAPEVFIDAPPVGGLQATAISAISSGTVTSITIVNQGAGYTVAPLITILPSPYDPNFTSGTTAITNATALCSLTGAGSLTGVLLTNSGAPVATTMSLTVAGAGATATVVPLFLTTVTGVSVTTAGTGYGTFTAITTIGGGNTQTGAFTNPQHNLTGFTPRPATIPVTLSGTGLSTVTTITDGGLFLSSPSPMPVTNGIITTVTSLVLTLGSANTTVRVQQLA